MSPEPIIYPDTLIRRILMESRVIAMVGASPKPGRPSHGVMKFLLSKGHKVYPVNPTCAGDSIHGQKVLAEVTDVPEPVGDLHVRYSSLRGVQVGVVNGAAAKRAKEAGLTVIMDRCPVIEYRRLGMA